MSKGNQINSDNNNSHQSKGIEKALAYAFGLIFIIVILVLAVAFPEPTDFQYTVFRIVLALAAAGIASVIPGFLEVEVSKLVRAGGAIAVFVIVFFFSPAQLAVRQVMPSDSKNQPPGIQPPK